jgi:cell division protein FtsB
MLVRTHIPFPLRIFSVVLLVLVGLWGANWVYDTGMRLAGFEKSQAQEAMNVLSARVTDLERENGELRDENTRFRQQLEIEKVTQRTLTQSLKTLQDENAALKEDTAFFRNLLSPDQGAGAVSIYHVKVERNHVVPGEYRYRLLLLKAGSREQEFSGSVQLLISGVQGERPISVSVPEAKAGKAIGMPVTFKYYQRLEGSFRLPEGMVPKSAQVRVFETGVAQPKWTRTTNL